VGHARGPARILAPAGSGKTKTLVSRVIELVARGADPGGILLLAFNRKAAEQLEERLAAAGIATTRRLCERGDRRPPAVHCATFNAFGSRYLREVAGARVRLTDARDQRALMLRAMEAAGAGLAELRPARGSDPVGAFLAGLARVRAGLEDPATVLVRIESLGERPVLDVPFAPVHGRYARFQAAAGEQSFDDQIYLAVVDMLADPAHRAFIEGRFDQVLVDEFQDLNGAQLALVDILSRPTREVFVVGDDDQLIYGWRFADPRGILGFHERMPPVPWSATYTLGTNYRCSRAVVEAAARLVANNAVREIKDVRPRDGAPAGAVRFFGAPAWPERAAAVCAFLQAQRVRLGCSWRDLAVLCRYRSQQLSVALALDDGRVPRTPVLGYRLFTHPAARLLRAYIDLALRPGEASGEQLRLLLNRPNRYLRDAVADDVAGALRPWERVLALAAAEPAAGPRPLDVLAAAVERLTDTLAAQAGLTAGDLVWSVIDAFGLEDWWRETADDGDRAGSGGGGDGGTGGRGGSDEDPLRILDGLLVLAESRPHPGSFLSAWDGLLADEEAGAGIAEDTLDREDGADDRVVIGTIHAAKGREYDAVVVPDYDCDVTRWEHGAIEEERRVVYVGVTRARDTALLTIDTSRPYRHPFLRELVEAPDAGEYEALEAWLAETQAAPEEGVAEASGALRRRLEERLAEIELLYPETVPEPDAVQEA
jgi:superfamily I DNA/RNA helicase